MNLLAVTLSISLLLLNAPSAICASASSGSACNNSPSLCSRSYGNISQLGAHDSPFVRDASTSYSLSGNQFYNSTVQLDAGVRLLTAQVYNYNGSYHLCHTSCALLDAGTLSNWLSTIKTWLDSNPSDVVTILLVNSDNASPSELASQFEAASIQSYAYTPPSTTAAPLTWPTLENLIANNTRLVTFVASLNPSSNTVAPYLMDEYVFMFENSYNNTSPSSFSCQPDRPYSVANSISGAISSNRLPLMNHFLYSQELLGIEIPNVNAINRTNAESGGAGNLGDAAASCTTQWGRVPAFVIVDFFNVGPAIDTIDRLNGVQGQTTGRLSVSTAILTANSTSSTSSTSSATGLQSLRGYGSAILTSLLVSSMTATLLTDFGL